ncbi:hypothetical protein KIPB_012820, partial [Kipferlia bialata]|eukprot:g12820.t1
MSDEESSAFDFEDSDEGSQEAVDVKKATDEMEPWEIAAMEKEKEKARLEQAQKQAAAKKAEQERLNRIRNRRRDGVEALAAKGGLDQADMMLDVEAQARKTQKARRADGVRAAADMFSDISDSDDDSDDAPEEDFMNIADGEMDEDMAKE